MLMIFIGPLISQALPMKPSMPLAMHGEPGCHGDNPHGKTQGEQPVLWAKCGYCSLLFNCPALPGSLPFGLFATPAIPRLHILSPDRGQSRPAVFPGARPRAPPSAG